MNPVVTAMGKDTEVEQARRSLRCPRPVDARRVKVDATDERRARVARARRRRRACRPARLDHLDGTLIIDRTEPDARREALRQLRPGSSSLRGLMRNSAIMDAASRTAPARPRALARATSSAAYAEPLWLGLRRPHGTPNSHQASSGMARIAVAATALRRGRARASRRSARRRRPLTRPDALRGRGRRPLPRPRRRSRSVSAFRSSSPSAPGRASTSVRRQSSSAPTGCSCPRRPRGAHVAERPSLAAPALARCRAGRAGDHGRGRRDGRDDPRDRCGASTPVPSRPSRRPDRARGRRGHRVRLRPRLPQGSSTASSTGPAAHAAGG